MADYRKQNYLTGAVLLSGTVAVTKIIGAIYKIPIFGLLGDEGTGTFNAAYQIYSLLLSIATAGIPVAVSRLVSASIAKGNLTQSRKYLQVGLVIVPLIGLLICASMLIWPNFYASTLLGKPETIYCIRALAPAVLFCCIISVYRGFTQGHSNMIPTAISQIIEVLGKLIFGLSAAWIFLSRGADTPRVAAGAIIGVTLGLAAGVPVLILYVKKVYPRNGNERIGETSSSIATCWDLIRIGVPITLSSSLIYFISVFETKILSNRLIIACTANGLTAQAAQTRADVLYGVFSKALTFVNLPSSLLVPLAVSVVPAISAFFANRETKNAATVMQSSTRIMNLLAMPACAGMGVLARPIFEVLMPGSDPAGARLLTLLAFSAYFICLQAVSNGYLQASGYEKMMLWTSLAGGTFKLLLDYFLVCRPGVHIYGAALGNLVGYSLISLFNVLFLKLKIGSDLKLFKAFSRPLLASLAMTIFVFLTNHLLQMLLRGLSSSVLKNLICLCVSVLIGICVYALVVIRSRMLNRDDVQLLPGGEKLIRLLKL